MAKDDDALRVLDTADDEVEVDEWGLEIKLALEARRQKAEWMEKHPRPEPSPAQMQRTSADDSIPVRAPSTTPTMRTGITARS